MIKSELLRLWSSRAVVTIGIVVLIEALIGGLGAAFLPALVSGLVSLNDVIPNATQADQLPASALEALSLDSVAVQAAVVDLAGGFGLGISVAGLGVFVLGALSMTNEYRRGSVVSSLLARPSRVSLLATKTAALVIVVLALCLPLAAIKGSLLGIGAGVQGVSVSLSFAVIVAMWIRGALALLLLAITGMGVGLLVRHSVTAVIIIFGALIVESSLRPLSALLTGGVTFVNYLPFGVLADAVRGPGMFEGAALSYSVGIGPGMLALLGWAIAALGLGVLRFARRDVPVLA